MGIWFWMLDRLSLTWVSLRTLYAFSIIFFGKQYGKVMWLARRKGWLLEPRGGKISQGSTGECQRGSTNQLPSGRILQIKLPLFHDWLLYMVSYHGACELLTASQKEGLGEGPRPRRWVSVYFSLLFVWLGRGEGGVSWGGSGPRKGWNLQALPGLCSSGEAVIYAGYRPFSKAALGSSIPASYPLTNDSSGWTLVQY